MFVCAFQNHFIRVEVVVKAMPNPSFRLCDAPIFQFHAAKPWFKIVTVGIECWTWMESNVSFRLDSTHNSFFHRPNAECVNWAKKKREITFIFCKTEVKFQFRWNSVILIRKVNSAAPKWLKTCTKYKSSRSFEGRMLKYFFSGQVSFVKYDRAKRTVAFAYLKSFDAHKYISTNMKIVCMLVRMNHLTESQRVPNPRYSAFFFSLPLSLCFSLFLSLSLYHSNTKSLFEQIVSQTTIFIEKLYVPLCSRDSVNSFSSFYCIRNMLHPTWSI